MKAWFLSLCIVSIFFTNSLQGLFADETISSEKKDLKILVLIISSDNTDAYIALQNIWKSYMHIDPKHFEVYFIRGNPSLSTPYEIKGNDLFVKSKESYVPGIVDKTVLSMEAMLPRLKEFDYVLRTNLSSFYVFPRLLSFVQSLPRKNCYCGIQMYINGNENSKFGLINFVSGAGILMSADLAEMLANGKQEIFKVNMEMPDDVLIGWFFQNKGVRSISSQRIDFTTRNEWLAKKDEIPQNAFHFRAKSNYNLRSPEENFSDELYIDQELLKMFYPKEETKK